jgi:hypothetical protein
MEETLRVQFVGNKPLGITWPKKGIVAPNEMWVFHDISDLRTNK